MGGDVFGKILAVCYTTIAVVVTAFVSFFWLIVWLSLSSQAVEPTPQQLEGILMYADCAHRQYKIAAGEEDPGYIEAREWLTDEIERLRAE